MDCLDLQRMLWHVLASVQQLEAAAAATGTLSIQLRETSVLCTFYGLCHQAFSRSMSDLIFRDNW